MTLSYTLPDMLIVALIVACAAVCLDMCFSIKDRRK